MSLNILILGEAGSGKSTAAVCCYKYLTDMGFNVDVQDEEARIMMPGSFEQRRAALKGTKVTISCGQAKITEKS